MIGETLAMTHRQEGPRDTPNRIPELNHPLARALTTQVGLALDGGVVVPPEAEKLHAMLKARLLMLACAHPCVHSLTRARCSRAARNFYRKLYTTSVNTSFLSVREHALRQILEFTHTIKFLTLFRQCWPSHVGWH